MIRKTVYRKSRGFTLPELMISITISAIISLAAGAMLFASRTESVRLPGITRMRQEFTIAQRYLKIAVLTGTLNSLVIHNTYGGSPAATGTSVSIADGGGDVRTIFNSGEALLTSLNGGTPDTLLANGVTNLEFSTIGTRGLTMDLTLEHKGTSIGGLTEIHFRR